MHVFCLRFWIRPADITRRSRDEPQEPQSSWISAVADARCHIISWSNYNRVPGANLWRIFFWLKNPLCATGFCDASIERVCLHAPAAWELQRRSVLSCEAFCMFFPIFSAPTSTQGIFLPRLGKWLRAQRTFLPRLEKWLRRASCWRESCVWEKRGLKAGNVKGDGVGVQDDRVTRDCGPEPTRRRANDPFLWGRDIRRLCGAEVDSKSICAAALGQQLWSANQKAVTTYLKSEQLLPFGCARQSQP